MKPAIDLSHSNFFNRNGYIQLEGLLTKQCTRHINLMINSHLEQKIERKSLSPSEISLASRDLWRSNSDLNQLLGQRKLAQIASELVNHRPIRLAFDQYLVPPISYTSMGSLNEISSIQGIFCGLLICLVSAETVITHDIFPSKEGSGTYFAADFDFPWDQLSTLKDEAFLLIAYAHERALYIRQDRDPQKNFLKQYGYTFGDRLSDQWHPIVYR